MNKCIFIGRLTKDPVTKNISNGAAVTNFTVAVDRIVGEGKQKEADYIPIVTWNKLAENCATYLAKGRLVAVEGRMQTRNYENDEGKKVYVTEIVAESVKFLESSKTSEAQQQKETVPASSKQQASEDPFNLDEML